MHLLPKDAESLLRAAATTALAVLVFAGLRQAGLAPGLSLFIGLILAGALSILGLATLRSDLMLPMPDGANGSHAAQRHQDDPGAALTRLAPMKTS